MKKILSTMLVAVLLITIVLPLFPGRSAAATPSSEEPLAVVGAGSDFQYLTREYNGVTYESVHAANAVVMREIIQSMKQNHPVLDDYFLLGDYDAQDYTAESSGAGLKAARGVLEQVYGLEEAQILALQGNHDPADTPGLAATGAHDREHYGVYLINEDDFSWCGGNPDQARATADQLEAYLNEKIRQGWTKPVFVLNHLPLHHSHRVGSGQDIADNRYARYLVDVLNEAGRKGLHIFYLFGHNHSGSYDSYLGGDCIALTPGGTMYVTDPVQGRVTDFQQVTLHFTYLNAGYLGYVSGQLTSTAFKIYEDRVEISRYSEDGLCSLKHPGILTVWDEGWEADTTRLESPWIQNQSPIHLSVTGETLDAPLDVGTTAAVQLESRGEELIDLTWESLNEQVATVQPGENGMEAVVTGSGYGTTQIKVTARGTSGVPAVLYWNVTVLSREAVQLEQSRSTPMYELVTDWCDLMPGERYMLLNRDTMGTASVLGGPETAQDRSADPMLLNTDTVIFGLPGETGRYTMESSGGQSWRLLPQGENRYVLSCAGEVSGYLCATAQVDDVHLSYRYSGGYRIASSPNSDGVIYFTWDAKKKLLTFSEFYDQESNRIISTDRVFALGWDETNGFRLAPAEDITGGAVQLYRKTGSCVPQLWMWVSGSGRLQRNASGDMGAKVMMFYEGHVYEVPLTADLLTKAYLQLPGQRQCSVYYNGRLLTEQFPITVSDARRPHIQTLTLLKNEGDLFALKSGSLTGKPLVTVNRNTPGSGSALRALSGTLIPAEAEVFSIVGLQGSYVRASDRSWIWEGEKEFAGYYFLKNSKTQSYLSADIQSNGLELKPEAPGSWRTNGYDTLTSGGSASADQRVIAFDGRGYYAAPRTEEAGVGYVYELDETIDCVLAYATTPEGWLEVGKTDLLTEGTITVATYYLDGSVQERQVPISLDQLQLRSGSLGVPGTYSCTLRYRGQVVCDDYRLTVYRKGDLGKRGTLTGTIATGAAGETLLTLQLVGENTPVCTMTVSDAPYRMENLLPGDYILRATGAGYVTWEKTVRILPGGNTMNLTLCVSGDVNADGLINTGDVAILYAHVRGSVPLTDAYQMACAEVNGDGQLNIGDVAGVYAKVIQVPDKMV